MNLERFKKVLDGDSIADIEKFLLENSSKITKRKKYSLEDRKTTIFKVFLYLSKTDAELREFILIDTNKSIEENLYNIVYGDYSICENGQSREFVLRKIRYASCASNCECAMKLKHQTNLKNNGTDYIKKRTQKTKETNIEKYGYEMPFQSADIQSKISNRGASNPNTKQKMKHTNIKKYGVDSTIHIARDRLSELRGNGNIDYDNIQQKVKKTNLEKYGFENPFQSEDIKNKIKSTNLARYGTENVAASIEIKDKINKTFEEKYGSHPLKIDSVRNKIQKTNQLRYGTKSFSQREYSDQAKLVLFNKDEFIDFTKDKSVKQISLLLGVDFSTVCDYFHKYEIELPRSSYETEIASFLKDHGIEFASNTRKIITPLELDFYIPEHKLAIEFNGLYWHSHSILGDKNYHLNKYLACEDKGIRLVMINEDEWIDRNISIKSKILNLCGKSEKGIGARKLSIKKIDNRIAHTFVEKYHIQGKTGTAIASYGAYHGNELVSVIQYNKQRGTGDIELIRFCTNGKLYAGVFSRLLKHSVDQEGYTQVISFADLRYSDGNVYEKNGFINSGIIKPDYKYIKGTKTYHKSTFTKKNISKKFGLDVGNLTESELMSNLGYDKIYDCGKIKYIY